MEPGPVARSSRLRSKSAALGAQPLSHAPRAQLHKSCAKSPAPIGHGPSGLGPAPWAQSPPP
eukprot:5163439-Pyramimonas_sp.AAC.1